jgi:hypothetical protein
VYSCPDILNDHEVPQHNRFCRGAALRATGILRPAAGFGLGVLDPACPDSRSQWPDIQVDPDFPIYIGVLSVSRFNPQAERPIAT